MHGPVDKLLTTASLAERPDFSIGAASVCPATRAISGPAGTIQVEPRVMQVLVTLAEADGAVVTRDVLFARCWGGVYVGDDSLNRAIAGLRRAMAATAPGSFEIETVPRTGYRLIGEVRYGDTAVGDRAPALAAGRGLTRRRLIATGAAAIAAGGIALWATAGRRGEPENPLIAESRAAMRSGSPADQKKALELLERAVRQSPGDAAAWGALALTRARIDEHAVGAVQLPASAVTEAAQRALQIDPDNADAEAALAIALPYFGDWLAAERRFDAVLQQHPDHLYVQDSRSFLLGAVGRMRESAVDRLPLSGTDPYDSGLLFRSVYANWFLGRIAEADRAAQRGLEMWPRDPGTWFARLWLLTGTGRFDRALAHIADERIRPPLPGPMVATLGQCVKAAMTRDPAQIAAASRAALAGARGSVAAVVNAMMLLNLMGDLDAAFRLAEAYYLERGPIIAAMSWRPGQPFVPDQRRRKTNMLFTPIASAMQRDPRFMPLMRDIGLADYWQRRGVKPDFMVISGS